MYTKEQLISILKSGQYDHNVLRNFNESLFTEDIINDYNILQHIRLLPVNLKGNWYLLSKVFSLKNYNYVYFFDRELLIKSEDINKINIFISSIKEIPSYLNSNIDLFKFLFKYKKYDLLNQFNSNLFEISLFDTKNGLNSLKTLYDDNMKIFDMTKNIQLLKKVLEEKEYQYLLYFDLKSSAVTELITSDNYIYFFEYLKSRYPNHELNEGYDFLKNKNIFNIVISNKLYDLLGYFNYVALDESLLDDYVITDILNVNKKLPDVLKISKKVFNYCIKYCNYELLNYISDIAWDENLINANNFLAIFNSLNNVPLVVMYSSKLLKICLDNKYYEYLNYFTNNAWKDEYIDDDFINNYGDDIKNLFNSGIPEVLKYNVKLLNLIIKKNLFEFIYDFDDSIFTQDIINENHQSLIKAKLNNNNFGIKNSNITRMFLDEYLINHDYRLVESIFKDYDFSKEDLIYLCPILSKLLKYNDEVLNTVDLNFLNLKLDFSLNELIQITRYDDIQKSILNLSSDKSIIFVKIMKSLKDFSNEYDICPIVVNVLNNLNNMDINIDVNNLTKDQINNLILLLQSDNEYKVNSNDDLFDSSIDYKIDLYLDKFKKEINFKTKDEIIEAILIKRYSLSYLQGKFIYDRYHDSVETLNDDFKMKEFLVNINNLFNINDLNTLKKMFMINGPKIKVNYKSALFLESSIRNCFAELYDKSLYKLDENDLFNVSDTVKEKVSKYDVPMYFLTKDFNLLGHCLHAYSNPINDYSVNYKNEWNLPKIFFHGICSSYCGNDKIAFASFNHPTLGFDRLFGREYLLSGPNDVYSDNNTYATSLEQPSQFLPPQTMKNETLMINEAVKERVIYQDNKCFKEQPSYIIYVIDDVDDLENFMTVSEKVTPKSKHFTATLKCAKDFNVPIVVVDRLYYDRYEKAKCDKLLEEFNATKDFEKAKELIIKFNNKFSEIFAKSNLDKQIEIFTDDLYIFYIKCIKNIIPYLDNPKEKYREFLELLNKYDEKYSMQLIYLNGHKKMINYIEGMEEELKIERSYSESAWKKLI